MSTQHNGAIAKAAQTAPAKASAGTPKTLRDLVMSFQPEFAKALPKVITPERFTRVALSALASTPKLMECNQSSFLGALMLAAQLGLEPNTPLGQAYLIPFNNNHKGIVECQFQIGYKGLIDLAYRSGEIASVQAHVVYEADKFEYEFGLEEKLRHVPAIGDRGAPTYVYAVFKMKNGGFGFDVMSVEDIKSHAKKYSQAYKRGTSPWQTNFEEMAKKTVLKRVLKLAPLRSDFVTAVVADSQTINFENTESGLVLQSDNVIEVEGIEVDADTGVIIDGE